MENKNETNKTESINESVEFYVVTMIIIIYVKYKVELLVYRAWENIGRNTNED